MGHLQRAAHTPLHCPSPPAFPIEQVRDDVDDALERMATHLLAEQQAAGHQPQPQQQQAEASKAAANGAAAQQQQGSGGGGKAPKRRRLAGVPEFCLVEA